MAGDGEVGSFLALLEEADAPAPAQPQQQRLGTLAAAGPGERGSGAAGGAAVAVKQEQQQSAPAPPSTAPVAGGGVPPAVQATLQQQATQLAAMGLNSQQIFAALQNMGAGGVRTAGAAQLGGVPVLQQPMAGLQYAAAGNVGMQGEPPAKRQALGLQGVAQPAGNAFAQFAMTPGSFALPAAGLPGAAGQQQYQASLMAQLQQQQQRQAAVPLQPVGIAANPALAAQVASNPALAAQFAANPALAAQFGLGGAYAAAGGAAGMRVAVDKGRNAALDHTFVAEDTTAKDHADEVMKRCEEVTQMLRKTLGKHTDGDRFGATNAHEGEKEYEQVEQPQMIEACGDTARYLKPYQLIGVNFLLLLYRSKVSGAILADEMGLGKTAQLITYLGCIRHLENDPGPHLVVVPASLLENWQRELARWCPALKVIVYYGKHRAVVRKRLNTLREKLAKADNPDEVNCDLSDLADPDLLAELAQNHKLEEAAAAAEAEEHGLDDDPYGAGHFNESDDEFDIDKEKAGSDAELQPEEAPPEWDIDAPCQAAPFDVMLTCYTLFERDSPEQRLDRGFLEKWRWSHLIMDEAHALKNRNASRTTRLRRVSNASRRRIMMTGTPLQNDLAELQNLLHFLLPSVFAAQGFEDLAEMLQGDDGEIAKLTERMKSLLGPFVLRRLKTEVAGQLTSKSHVTEFIEMTEEQAALYSASLARMRSQLTGKAAAAAADRSNKGVERFLRTLGAKKISHMFTHLRKIAQHPLLVRSQYTDEQVAVIARMAFDKSLFGGAATEKRVREELQGYSDFSLHAFCYNAGPDFATYRLDQSHMMASTKFRYLAKLLKKLKDAGSRPLIFSQWTAVLDIMEWMMEVMQLPFVRLDGSTAVDTRLATVDRFNHNDDVFAFLLSTRAGGQGLNLTGADTVILHDVDFNPQIDRQAEDRCHRLGQTRPVTVYRLITKGSVDQNIYNLSQRKLRMDSAVLDGITTGKGGKADETQQMGFILANLLNEAHQEEGAGAANGAAAH
ncbi:CHROMATIN REMODELING 19 [Micractinium conductrix]|uniref:CHROMATIN REMODELING 19 n=1 Tax=Micractinium conductrix TaxID=554055 RepID=A0A2P6V6M7_9CHLO|nr:CHROMATIN REMODELING 19 [Micractinium conductrix]|eukprot:PSC69740.1 CHROMATIN REMODELING 19 [Micractinium conductrix]